MSAPVVVMIADAGWVVRNYLLGDFLPVVLEEAELVVLSPLADDRSFRQRLEERGVRLEALPPHATAGRLHQSVLVRRHTYHQTWCGTDSMEVKMRRGRTQGSTLRNIQNTIEHAVARAISGPRLLRLLDTAEHRYSLKTPAAGRLRRLFEEIQPDVVFAPAPLYKTEWIPVHVARSLGISTAVAILSWDNLSTKARLPAPADRYILWTEKMRAELLDIYPDVPDDRIKICGAPQFDFYFREELRPSRQEYFESWELDPARPLVVYSGVTPGLMPREPHIVASLAAALQREEVPGRPQLLVRLHPKDGGDRYAGFEDRFPDVRVAVPGRDSQGRPGRWAPTVDDMRELTGTLLHGDVHLNVASTMSIDAAILDRPVVNVRFDPRQPGDESAPGMKIYEYTHYRPVAESGAVRVAHSVEEMLDHVTRYLEDPSLDTAARRRIVRRICGVVDGRAAERVARAVLDLAHRRARAVDRGERTALK